MKDSSSVKSRMFIKDSFFLNQRLDFFDPLNIKWSTMFSDRSPATPSTRTTPRQWYRRTPRPTSSPAPRTPTRPTRLARPMKASWSSTCHIRTFWTPVRRMVRADVSCGPARLARKKRSPSTGGKPPLCAKDGAWERSVSIHILQIFQKHQMYFSSLCVLCLLSLIIIFSFSIFVKIKKIIYKKCIYKKLFFVYF